MLDLESAIRFHTEEAEKMKLHKAVNEIILGTEAYERKLQEHTQTAEWLRELAERRKQPEIIHCGECVHSPHTVDGKIRYCKRHARYKLKDYFCGDAERRTE